MSRECGYGHGWMDVDVDMNIMDSGKEFFFAFFFVHFLMSLVFSEDLKINEFFLIFSGFLMKINVMHILMNKNGFVM